MAEVIGGLAGAQSWNPLSGWFAISHSPRMEESSAPEKKADASRNKMNRIA
jgi:hypothetical protein